MEDKSEIKVAATPEELGDACKLLSSDHIGYEMLRIARINAQSYTPDDQLIYDFPFGSIKSTYDLLRQ